MVLDVFEMMIVYLVQYVIIFSLVARLHNAAKILATQSIVVLVLLQRMFYMAVGDVNIVQTVVTHFQCALKDSVY